MSLPVFMITMFASAFLLFLVQPMIGKMILPRLGGTPQVWNTCMVFFQAALLLGYAYTHFISTRLKLRTQLIVHSTVLFVPILVFVAGTIMYGQGSEGSSNSGQDSVNSFFYAAKEALNPIGGGNPIPMTLWWLTLVVGIPFFVVATSAPLLQKWFGQTGHPAAEDPYFLYAASNVGSFASLLAYPFFLERTLTLNIQSWTWVIGYLVLVGLVIGCAVIVFKSASMPKLAGTDKEKTETAEEPKAEAEPETAPEEVEKETAVKEGAPPKPKAASSFKKGSKQRRKKGKKGQAARSQEKKVETRTISKAVPSTDDTSRLGEVTPLRRLRWVGLTMIPSSLMLGMTTHITTDLSPIPLLWIIPLMTYLFSFVLVFSRWPIVWVGTPHLVMVIAQPFAVAWLILSMVPGLYGHGDIAIVIFIHWLAFFLTTMVCHGELAKDRPSTQYLTEFYLLMSVGGVLGGMFNALVAPVVFSGVIEYILAIAAAGLLRPNWIPEGILERLYSVIKDSSDGKSSIRESDQSLPGAPYFRDIGFAFVVLLLAGVLMFFLRNTNYRLIIFAVPLAVTILLMGRSLRYGLAVGSILLILCFFTSESEVFRIRSYYGVIKVLKTGYQGDLYTSLTHGTTLHGQNYMKPADPKDWGDPTKDFSRLATTYYHHRGPAGVIMEKFNWFSNTANDWYRVPENEYWADNRMPASLVGFGYQPLSFGNLPVGNLIDLWSEPPFATVGLGTGTMVAYAHPFQHMHYYEIDNQILLRSVPRRFLSEDKREPTNASLPHDLYVKYLRQGLENNPSATYFSYLADAKRRGSEVWVFMGDARLRMAQPYVWNPDTMKNQWNNAYSVRIIDGAQGGGPDGFYHMMVVDAFSSDAIPVHLLTKQAVQMYFQKLTEEGILCVHVSNRHLNLVPVVADIASVLGYAWKRGNDRLPAPETPSEIEMDPKNKGRSISTWVMVARKPEYFHATMPNWDNPAGEAITMWSLEEPPLYSDLLSEYVEKMSHRGQATMPIAPYWTNTPAYGHYMWTDDFNNIFDVFGKKEH